MLYSFWLILALLGGFGVVIGIGRFLTDTQQTDGSDVVTLIVTSILNLVVGLNSAFLDFPCANGSFCVNGVQTYQGMWMFTYVFFALSLTSGVFTFIAMLKMRQLNELRRSVGSS